MLRRKSLFFYSAFIMSVTISLTGCFHENPLNNSNKKETASFLVNASKYAEHKLKLTVEGQDGHIYRDCMDNKAKPKTCNALYPLMIDYAKSQNTFPNVTVSDLKDQKLWDTLKEDYEIERFNAV